MLYARLLTRFALFGVRSRVISDQVALGECRVHRYVIFLERRCVLLSSP